MSAQKWTEERWLNAGEAAEYFGVTRDTMLSLLPDIPGAVKTKGTKGSWRVKASAIDEAMRKRTEQS